MSEIFRKGETSPSSDGVTQHQAAGAGGGGLSDGDYGDVTVGGSGTTMTIDNDAVTYAKMQNVSATDKVLGRSTSGAGDVEEIACTAAGRAILDDANAAAQRTTLDVPSNSEAILDTIIDAKGDLISATAADTPVRLAVGTNGHVLTADSAESTGLKWATAPGAGDLILGRFTPQAMDNWSVSPSAVPALLSNGRQALAFDATTDESCVMEGQLPANFAGAGTLKLTLWYCAATTTAADDVRWDVVTEFRSPGAGEAASTDNYDGTADSTTGTFSTTSNSVQSVTITLTPGTTPAAGDLYRIKLTRDANHGTDDSLSVDCMLLGALFWEDN